MAVDYEKFKINVFDINRFSGQNIIFADKEKKDGGKTEGYLGTDDTVSILRPNGVEDTKSVTLSDSKVATILDPLFEKYCEQRKFIQPRVFKNPEEIFADVNAHYQALDENVPRLVDIQLERYDEQWISQLSPTEQAEAYHQYAFLLSRSAFFDVVESCVDGPSDHPSTFKDKFGWCTQGLSIVYTQAQLPQLIQSYQYALQSLSLRNDPHYERTAKLIQDIKKKIEYCIWTDFVHFKTVVSESLKDNDELAKLVESKLYAAYKNEAFWESPQAYIDGLAGQRTPKKEDKLFLELLQRIKPNLW